MQQAVDGAFAKFKDLKEGKNADYIPALAKVDPNLFGIAVVTTDGKVYTAGDVSTEVSIQSISKVFTMAQVIQEQGLESVEKRIGVDATGARFNSIIAVEGVRTVVGTGAPEMNPLVNPGAISATSMVTGASADDVWRKIIGFHNDAAGRSLNVLQDVYKSESDTNQRNQAIGALMLAYGYIKNNWQQAVDLYTRQCSIGVNAKDLATMAATLAAGGKNPVTGKQVLDASKVPGVLAVMATAGLYDDSGKWLYHTGLPAKSGVGGGLLAVSPGKFGIAVVSPPLDDAGNSVRAQRAIAAISNALGGNPYAAKAREQEARTRPPRRYGSSEPGNVPWLAAFMDWLADSLRENLELALFLSIALGYGLGSLRFRGFQLGPVLGTLVAGLLVGQVGIAVPAAMQSAFFLLFLFAIGFRTGPDFFHGLRSSALPQIGLTVFLCVVALGLTWAFATGLALDGGTAAGLVAGALTNSTALGTATRAASALGGERAEHLANNVATAYAITYFLGTLLVVWFLPAIGPRLMRVNLMDACKELERTMGIGGMPAAGAAGSAVMVRAYRLPGSLAGRTVRAVEDSCAASTPVTIERLRRGSVLVEVTPGTRLEADDVIAVGGRRPAVLASSGALGHEVDDPELLDVPRISADLVLTNRKFSQSTLGALRDEVETRGIYLLGLRRAGRELPFTPGTVVERGDILAVTGARANIARVADEIGFAEFPTSATDLTVVAATIACGGLIGLPTATFAGLELGMSAPVGVLLGGLTVGYLRSVNPRFGRIPEASLWLLESLGLAAFLALAGLSAGPALIEALRNSGVTLIGVGVVIALLPHVATILVGYYGLRMHPGVLLGVCAGAGTSAPALSQLEKAAGSRIPTLGYGVACAVGNVLLAFWGTLLVVAGSR